MARDLTKLAHARNKLRIYNAEAQVIVLNTGALVGPEATAMLQALHSRSLGGFDHHFLEFVKRGAEKFMDTFFVGYGHKSIGDCGTITIFVEGVSMLCAKAIQDWPHYAGQESSTRYIDFSNQPFIDPLNTDTSAALLERERALHLKTLEEVKQQLLVRHPQQKGEKDSVYEKAIAARAFDIARSLLPAGASTNLAWHMNIRQIGDHLMLLRHHPLLEVRSIADAIEKTVREAYPSSFGHKQYPETEAYNDTLMRQYYYQQDSLSDFQVLHDGISRKMLEAYRSAMRNRPAKTELPRKINECGMLTFRFPLDFGSFRDIQRHRAVVQQMPLVTTRHGFEPWYILQMDGALRDTVQDDLNSIENTLADIGCACEQKQYYVPMGYRLPNQLSGGLHSLVYLAELRSTSSVHPTLQPVALKMAKELHERFSTHDLHLHVEDAQWRFDIKRGTHDITRRESA